MNDADNFSMDFDDSRKLAFGCPGNVELDPPVLSVYLASALTNVVEAERDESERLRVVIRESFESYDCQGVRFKVYDPADVTSPGSKHSDDEVYATDHGRTSAADLVIFCLAAPSLGVGMEAQISAECTLPRVVISKRESIVSRMFRGLFSPTIAWIEYSDPSDVTESLAKEICAIAASAVESACRRRRHVNDLTTEPIGQTIMKRRLIRQITLQQLASVTDIREGWLQRLELDPFVGGSITFIQFHRIADALDVRASLSASGVPTLAEDDTDQRLSKEQSESLTTLVEFARTREETAEDGKLLAVWQDYFQQQSEEAVEAVRHRGNTAIAVEEWKRRYEEKRNLLF